MVKCFTQRIAYKYFAKNNILADVLGDISIDFSCVFNYIPQITPLSL